MDKTQLIKQEIERLQRNLNECISPNNPILPGTLNVTFDRLKDFIDSLPEPVSEDLEEASWNYSDKDGIGYGQRYAMQIDFKAGARWQKQQMMKDAVEGTVVGRNCSTMPPFQTKCKIVVDRVSIDAKEDDKVKVIIIKSEQQ